MSDFRHRAEPVVKRSRSIHKGQRCPFQQPGVFLSLSCDDGWGTLAQNEWQPGE